MEESDNWTEWIGSRVCIRGKEGVLRFYGSTTFAMGTWCGIELDEPLGKNDGSVAGINYFSCEPKHGIFALHSNVEKLTPPLTTKNEANKKSLLPLPYKSVTDSKPNSRDTRMHSRSLKSSPCDSRPFISQSYSTSELNYFHVEKLKLSSEILEQEKQDKTSSDSNMTCEKKEKDEDSTEFQCLKTIHPKFPAFSHSQNNRETHIYQLFSSRSIDKNPSKSLGSANILSPNEINDSQNLNCKIHNSIYNDFQSKKHNFIIHSSQSISKRKNSLPLYLDLEDLNYRKPFKTLSFPNLCESSNVNSNCQIILDNFVIANKSLQCECNNINKKPNLDYNDVPIVMKDTAIESSFSSQFCEPFNKDRPASTYTISSTDTGYQDDFDPRSSVLTAGSTPNDEPEHISYLYEEISRKFIPNGMNDSGGFSIIESEEEHENCNNMDDIQLPKHVQDEDNNIEIDQIKKSESNELNCQEKSLASLSPNSSNSTTLTIEEKEINDKVKQIEPHKQDKADNNCNEKPPINSSVSNNKPTLENKPLLSPSRVSPKMSPKLVPQDKNVKVIKTPIQYKLRDITRNNLHENNPTIKSALKNQKKGKWDDVNAKIAASLAEERSKTKRDIRSKTNTNLSKLQDVNGKQIIENKPRITIQSTTPQSNKAKLGLKAPRSDVSRTDEGKENQPLKNVQSKQSSKKLPNGLSQSPSDLSTTGSLVSELSSSRVTSEVSGRDIMRTTAYRPRNPPAPTRPKTELKTTTPSRPGTKPSRPDISPRRTDVGPSRARPPMCTTRAIHTPSSVRERLPPRRAPVTIIDTKRIPLWMSKADLAKEIQHLEANCEARTKELQMVKMHLNHAAVGFDAFAALVQYLTEDLDAFANPCLVSELKTVKDRLASSTILIENYQEQVEALKNNNELELQNVNDMLHQAHNNEIISISENYNEIIENVLSRQKQEIEIMNESHSSMLFESKMRYQQSLQDFQKEHILTIEELKINHENEIQEVSERYRFSNEQAKQELEALQEQYTALQSQVSNAEQALKKGVESKIQWINSKKSDLAKEVESLQAVLELKQNEITKFRNENYEMKKELEELPLLKERIKKLRAREEDLEALLEEKVNIQRELASEHDQVVEWCNKESSKSKRLTMENEELQWRLRSLESSMLSSASSLQASFNKEQPEEDADTSPRSRFSSLAHVSWTIPADPSPEKEFLSKPKRKSASFACSNPKNLSSSPRSKTLSSNIVGGSKSSPNNSFSVHSSADDSLPFEIYGEIESQNDINKLSEIPKITTSCPLHRINDDSSWCSESSSKREAISSSGDDSLSNCSSSPHVTDHQPESSVEEISYSEEQRKKEEYSVPDHYFEHINLSPRCFAGEAMIQQDETSLSLSHLFISEETTTTDSLKQNEIFCKHPRVEKLCQEDGPSSMETSNQNMAMTNSTDTDISWDDDRLLASEGDF